MKQNPGAAIKLPKIPKKEHTRYAGMAYRPGGLSVPLKVVEQAVETVIRKRLEKEWGRPVSRSELRRNPSLPALTEHPLLRKLARAENRKTAPTVPKVKTGKRPGIAGH